LKPEERTDRHIVSTKEEVSFDGLIAADNNGCGLYLSLTDGRWDDGFKGGEIKLTRSHSDLLNPVIFSRATQKPAAGHLQFGALITHNPGVDIILLTLKNAISQSIGLIFRNCWTVKLTILYCGEVGVEMEATQISYPALYHLGLTRVEDHSVTLI
jgi:hypothetical protein